MARENTPTPHPIDVHVGLCVRGRRHELGMSQSTLADALGVSFQQVQKYERGANRVSASMLWEMSEAMEVPVTYFYEGYGDGAHRASPESPNSPSRFFQTPDGFDLAQAFLQLPEGPVRKIVLTVARQLATLPTPH
ncbi:transcriptional regulator with XRE-family HTH domain [Phenylobacterium haematophilum]|uniref:Transcriptional regulator with XRE-family HTH domain n=1 Tax=Phenylobacterium haematophilum TaxID=98513 RepID=A0A840A4M1_9CAUL|nr:helix-turn-helix transcriptional regulator [Phenylobacterium haematophilum]MBB3892939.1 transcriptional regulator with XRE-family HTH domain [Phenylobacterium haematophilum]